MAIHDEPYYDAWMQDNSPSKEKGGRKNGSSLGKDVLGGVSGGLLTNDGQAGKDDGSGNAELANTNGEASALGDTADTEQGNANPNKAAEESKAAQADSLTKLLGGALQGSNLGGLISQLTKDPAPIKDDRGVPARIFDLLVRRQNPFNQDKSAQNARLQESAQTNKLALLGHLLNASGQQSAQENANSRQQAEFDHRISMLDADHAFGREQLETSGAQKETLQRYDQVFQARQDALTQAHQDSMQGTSLASAKQLQDARLRSEEGMPQRQADASVYQRAAFTDQDAALTPGDLASRNLLGLANRGELTAQAIPANEYLRDNLHNTTQFMPGADTTVTNTKTTNPKTLDVTDTVTHHQVSPRVFNKGLAISKYGEDSPASGPAPNIQDNPAWQGPSFGSHQPSLSQPGGLNLKPFGGIPAAAQNALSGLGMTDVSSVADAIAKLQAAQGKTTNSLPRGIGLDLNTGTLSGASNNPSFLQSLIPQGSGLDMMLGSPAPQTLQGYNQSMSNSIPAAQKALQYQRAIQMLQSMQ